MTAAAPSALRFFGQREERRARRQAHAAAASSSSGVRADRPARREWRRRERDRCQLPTGTPAARAQVHVGLHLSMKSSGIELQQTTLGVAAQPVDLRRFRIACHISARRPAIAPFGQRRRGQRPQEPRGALDLARACRTTRRRPGSRDATSSGRTRCPACTPTYRVERANPFSSSVIARSGRPAPPGYGSARKIEPNR